MCYKVLLIGGSGQVGREIYTTLINNGIEIHSPSSKELDIRHINTLIEYISDLSINLIINASAYTDVQLAEKQIDSAHEVNAEGVKNIAIAAKKFNIPVIHISTDYVFDGNKLSPYTEKDTVQPINVYGSSKLSGELALKQTIPNYIIIRTSWVFGLQGNNFVKKILELCQTKDELLIVSDQTGCPTYAPHIATLIFEILKSFKTLIPVPFGTYHFCGEPATTWYDFARLILTSAGKLDSVKLTPIKSGDLNSSVNRPINSVLSNDKINSYLDIEKSWKIGLEQFFSRFDSDS